MTITGYLLSVASGANHIKTEFSRGYAEACRDMAAVIGDPKTPEGDVLEFPGADAAVLAEREACAKIAESATGVDLDTPGGRQALSNAVKREIAVAIRARGKP